MVLRPFSRPRNERGLYERLIQIGFDGSLLHDHTKVYVLNKRPRWRGIMKIDYFHGMYKGTPIAQMAREDELDVRAVNMINISKGFTAQRITNLQRRWRRWKMTANEGPPINKRKKAAEPEAKPMPRKKKRLPMQHLRRSQPPKAPEMMLCGFLPISIHRTGTDKNCCVWRWARSGTSTGDDFGLGRPSVRNHCSAF